MQIYTKKAALKLLFLSMYVAVMFLQLFLTELSLTEIASAEVTLPEFCSPELRSTELHESRVFAQVDDFSAPFATHELLLHSELFAFARAAFPYLTCTHVHYQHGS